MTHNSRQGNGRKGGPAKRRRKPYAWERGLVGSPIPPGARLKRCKNQTCTTEVPAKDLRYGYCASCWSGRST